MTRVSEKSQKSNEGNVWWESFSKFPQIKQSKQYWKVSEFKKNNLKNQAKETWREGF